MTPMLSIQQVKGDTHLVVRRPGDCNMFKDANCRLPPPHLEFNAQVPRAKQLYQASFSQAAAMQPCMRPRGSACRFHGFLPCTGAHGHVGSEPLV